MPVSTDNWTGGSADWSIASDWSNGVPTGATNASIATGNGVIVTVSGTATANSLTIAPSASASTNLDITGTLTVGALTLAAGSSFTANATVSIEAGAVLSASSIVVNTYDSIIGGGGVETITGNISLASNSLVLAGAHMIINGAVSGAAGSLRAYQGDLLELNGSDASTVVLQSGGAFILDQGASLTGGIEVSGAVAIDFSKAATFAPARIDIFDTTGSTAVIDLKNVVLSSATISGSTLSLVKSGGATLNLTTYVWMNGSFNSTLPPDYGILTASDGAGGTLLSIGPGVTQNWKDATTANWTTAADWSSGFVPTPSDAVVIGGTHAENISVTDAEQIASLTMNNGLGDILDAGTLSVAGSITINAGAIDVYGGGVLTASTITIAATPGIGSGAQLYMAPIGSPSNNAGTVNANIVNNNTIEAVNSGTLVINGSITGVNGLINVQGNTSPVQTAKLELNGAVSGQEIALYANGYLKLDQAASVGSSNSIWVEGASSLNLNGATSLAAPIILPQKGVALDLVGVAISSYSYAGHTLTLHETNGQTLALSVYTNTPGSSLASGTGVLATSDGTGGTLISYNNVAAPTVYFNPNLYITNKATQTFSGSVGAGFVGTTVVIIDNGAQIGSATVQSNNYWSTTVTLVGQGAHVISAVDTLPSGPSGSSSSYKITLDTIAPTVAITGATGSSDELINHTISGTITGADANTSISIYEGSTDLGGTYVSSDGTWSATVTLANGGANVLTAVAVDNAGNKGTSNSITVTVNPFSGLSSDTGTETQLSHPNAMSTWVAGSNAAGFVFGNYQDANGAHPFVYNPRTGAYIDIVPPDGGAINSSVLIGGNGDAYGSFQTSVAAGGAPVTDGYVFDPTTQIFTDIADPSSYSGPGSIGSYSSISIDGISSSGLVYGFYSDSSNQLQNTPFVYNLATQSIEGFPQFGGYLTPNNISLTGNGILYSTNMGSPGPSNGAWLYDTKSQTQINLSFPNAGGNGFTLNGATTSGLFYGSYQDLSNFSHSFIYDSVSSAETDIVDPNANSSVNGSNTYISGVTDTGLVYGGYYDASNQQHSFVYDTTTQAYSDLTPETCATSLNVIGATAGGYVYGDFTDTDGAIQGFVYDTLASTYSILSGPSGATGVHLGGWTDAGLGFGSYTTAGGADLAFIYDSSTAGYTTIIDPAQAAGGYTWVNGIDASGLVYGDYENAAGQYEAFVYNPDTNTYGQPGGSIVGVTPGGAFIGNIISVGSGSQHGYIYTPGGTTVGLGQTITFTLGVNNEALNVSTGAALTLSNGAMALYHSALSSNDALVFAYTVAAGSNYNTKDLRVTGFTGTIADPSGATLDPTSYVVLDTKLIVVAPPAVSITSAGGATNQLEQTISGTLDPSTGASYVTLYDGGTQIGTAYADSNGAWTANVYLTGAGANVVTATVAENGGNTDTSNAITFNVAPIAGFTVDTGTIQTFTGGGQNTSILGSDGGFYYFGNYQDATGSHAFVYDSIAGVSTPLVNPHGGSNIAFTGVGANGDAYGSFTGSDGTSYLFAYDPASGSLIDFPDPNVALYQNSNIQTITSNGIMFGWTNVSSSGASGVGIGGGISEGPTTQVPFYYNLATHTYGDLSSLLGPSGPGGSPWLQTSISDSGIIYGSVSNDFAIGGNGAESFTLDPTKSGGLTIISDPNAANGPSLSAATTIYGVLPSGIVYGEYTNANGVAQPYTYDPSTQVYSDITAPFQINGGFVWGATDGGLIYGYFNTKADQRQGYVYDTLTQSIATITGPAGASDVEIFGLVDASQSRGGLADPMAYGEYADANGVYQGFLYDVTPNASNPFTHVMDPGQGASGASNVAGISFLGYAYGYYADSSGAQKSYVFNLQTKAFVTIDDPAGRGSSLWSIDANGNFYGTYTDASCNNSSFVYDPVSGTYGTPSDLVGGQSTQPIGGNSPFSDVYGYVYNQGASIEGFAYTAGDGVLHVGQTATFVLSINNENLHVSSGAHLTLNNGATAIYDAADSAASQLAFTYTVASGAPYSTQDLRVTGFVGTITDPSGATIDPTSSVVSDTKLVVAANAAIPPTLSITTPSALLKTASLTLSGTIDAADAGQTVSIYDGSTLLGTVAPAAGGAWSTTVTLSGGGVHMLTAQAGSPGLVGTSSAVTYVLAPGPISVAQALSFETAGLVAPVGAAFTLADTAADLGALTASQIAGLATLGVTRLVATDIDLTFSSAQTSALAAAGISLSEPGAQVWTWRVDGSYDILYSGVAGQIYTSYDAFFNADGSRRDTHYYGITGQGFSDYDVVFASGAVSDVHYYGVTGAPFDNYDVIYGAGGAKTSEAWYIGSALYQTEGFNADGSAHDIRYYGITGQAFTNFDEIYGAGGVVHDIFYHHITGLPFSDYDVVYNADGTKHDIHYYGVTGQAYADYDVVFNADGTTHDIRYNNLTGQAFTSFDVTYGAGGVVNDIHYYGVTGQPFTDYDVVYAPGWVLTSETWNNGASPYQAEVWFADGGYSIQYDGLTGSETAEQDDYGPGAALMAIGGDMADGSGRLALYGSGLTVTRTAGALSVQSGPDVYTLDPHAVEKIIEVGASETYIFHAGFGATSINGFGASGAGHDTLQLDVSGFSYLTAGMTQAQDLAAVLAHATTSGNGANLVIADTAATPDTLTLLGVTSATINANPAAVKFV